MSYIAYINGNLLNLGNSTVIPYTKQVNDLARFDNRQSNFTHKFIVPFVAQNIKSMEFVYMVGNQSNIPYQKNTFDLIDADSGEHLIYNGWAIVTMVNDKGYEINVTDGIIDFYRKIENKNLTDIGISELNHAKSLQTIKQTWKNELPFIYALSDYNGKNEFIAQNGQYVNINTDFQVPSARISYLWNKIHEFAGFTFSGSYFQSENFLNWFVTYPKPVPTLEPIVELVTQQQSNIVCVSQEQPDFSYIDLCNANLLPNSNSILNLPTGSYRIKVDGLFYTSYNGSPSIANPNIVYYISANTGTLNSELGESVIVNYNAGDSFFLQPPFFASSGSVVTTIERVLGYDANFENAFLEFSVTDFVKEVITHGALTQFKDKYSNNIEYLTIDEIFKIQNIENWSNKFINKSLEKYKIGNYSKRNYFKYRYNTQNENHNDGFISIADENLKEKTEIINSKIYSPEKNSNLISGQIVNVFKIWEKELKENLTVNYKDLFGRFYFLRIKNVIYETIIGSESLNNQLAVQSFKVASYEQMNFNSIINVNYSLIKSILNKGKIIDVYFYLNFLDIQKFNFKNLIYIEQLSSYYLINKIYNFIKEKPTKCELIEVDYDLIINSTTNSQNTGTYINIDSFTINGCILTINYSTDAPIGTVINLYRDFFVVFGNGTELITSFITTGINNTSTFLLEIGGNYNLRFITDNIIPELRSNFINFDNTASCIVNSPTQLTITSVNVLSTDNLSKKYKINFTTDAVLPRKVYIQSYTTPGTPVVEFGFPTGGWSGYTQNVIATSQDVICDVSTIIVGSPIKFQIKIGNLQSNEFTII